MIVRTASLNQNGFYTRDPFVTQATREALRQIERDERIQHTRIQTMLERAADPTNYLHHVYRHTLGKLTFEFRVTRTTIALHSVTRLY